MMLECPLIEPNASISLLNIEIFFPLLLFIKKSLTATRFPTLFRYINLTLADNPYPSNCPFEKSVLTLFSSSLFSVFYYNGYKLL